MAVWKALRFVGMFAAVVSITQVIAPNAGASQDPPFIAGTQPDRRPENAPTITEVDKSGTWYDQALWGVVEPYPYSLRFLEDQGNWYTPFTRPGMPGPYDIRGWFGQ